jgi:hypothetical protein
MRSFGTGMRRRRSTESFGAETLGLRGPGSPGCGRDVCVPAAIEGVLSAQAVAETVD